MPIVRFARSGAYVNGTPQFGSLAVDFNLRLSPRDEHAARGQGVCKGNGSTAVRFVTNLAVAIHGGVQRHPEGYADPLVAVVTRQENRMGASTGRLRLRSRHVPAVLPLKLSLNPLYAARQKKRKGCSFSPVGYGA